MNYKDKAKLLRDRHLQIAIEWGRVKNMFSNMSDMSNAGVAEFLEILNGNNEDEIQNKLTVLIQKEHDKQE